MPGASYDAKLGIYSEQFGVMIGGRPSQNTSWKGIAKSKEIMLAWTGLVTGDGKKRMD